MTYLVGGEKHPLKVRVGHRPCSYGSETEKATVAGACMRGPWASIYVRFNDGNDAVIVPSRSSTIGAP